MSASLTPSPSLESASQPDLAVLAAAEELLGQQDGQEAVTPLTLSPFALRDDHEFPTSPTRTVDQLIDDHQDAAMVRQFADGKMKAALAALTAAPLLPPALPGTPASPFRHCSCVGSLPGRVCFFCHGTKWTRLCPRCEGEGRVDLNVRRGAERSQPCGFCGGKGILPANLSEIEEATRLAEAFAAGPEGQAMLVDDSTAAPEFRRAVRLPGIGVTATKRVGTLDARKRERKRLAKRTAKRKKEKAAAKAA